MLEIEFPVLTPLSYLFQTFIVSVLETAEVPDAEMTYPIVRPGKPDETNCLYKTTTFDTGPTQCKVFQFRRSGSRS